MSQSRVRMPFRHPGSPARPGSPSRVTQPGSQPLAALQRAVGNQAVQRLLVQRKEGAHKEINLEEDPVQRLILRAVDPTFPVARPAPKRSNSDASTTKVKEQTFGGNVVKDDAAGVFKYKLTDFTSNGEIQLVYYTNDHYPAPAPEDDTGPLSNVTKGNWRAVAKNLHDNRTGIADDWSAYAAEPLHENYHWNTEWVNTFTPEFRKAETKLENLKAPIKQSGWFGKKKPDLTQGEAEAKLKPRADKIVADMVKTAKKNYFKLGDSPGDPPYIAQAPAVDALENRVRTYGPTL
ncbi:MAG: hypothetical protein IT303_10400 [Dehalococcoidia bacterium]|nr:hypothetical protein [Dehalococcoidia bacterium]